MFMGFGFTANGWMILWFHPMRSLIKQELAHCLPRGRAVLLTSCTADVSV